MPSPKIQTLKENLSKLRAEKRLALARETTRRKRKVARQTLRLRKKDTRKKSILGELALGWMETHPDFYGQILEGLSDTLVDTSARALFALEAPENFPLEIKTQNRRRIIIGGLVYF